MKILYIRTLVVLCVLLGNLVSTYAQKLEYCFRTVDIRNGLSQNSVNDIFQDRTGFVWIGTKDGLNRYDGHSFRVYNSENSGLGRNFITTFFEDTERNIWVGTDGGVYIYNSLHDSFTAFEDVTEDGTVIHDFVTMIAGDEEGNVWISVENQGLFHYKKGAPLCNYLTHSGIANITCFWMEEDTCWLGLYADNLYYTKSDFASSLFPYKNADGVEVFKDDIVNCIIKNKYNHLFVATASGLTEIDMATNKSYKILSAYVRTLQFKSDTELWIGTETGLYIYNLVNKEIAHITVPEQDDPYALADNAIYAIYRDCENGMWVGTYFGGVNYFPYQWTYFEKFYPREGLQFFGRRIREICEDHDGTLWIGTEDKGRLQRGLLRPRDKPLLAGPPRLRRVCAGLWTGARRPARGGVRRITRPLGVARLPLRHGHLRHAVAARGADGTRPGRPGLPPDGPARLSRLRLPAR